MRPLPRRCRTRCRAPSSATRKATSSSATCSIAASRPRPSTASRRASPSIRTACASTSPSATSSTGTSCPTTPSTASPSSAPTRCSASTPSAARPSSSCATGSISKAPSSTSAAAPIGRIQSSLALGGNSGPWGVFVAVEGIKDGGFRDFSEAEIKRMYADMGVKGDGKEFHLNFTGANNTVGVTAAAPEQLLDLGWERTFTSPQTTDNEMHMLSLNGSVKATPTLTLSGVTYYRWFKQTARRRQHRRCGGLWPRRRRYRRMTTSVSKATRQGMPTVRSTFDDNPSYGSHRPHEPGRPELWRLAARRGEDAAVRAAQPVPDRHELRSRPCQVRRQQRARLLRTEVCRQQLRPCDLFDGARRRAAALARNRKRLRRSVFFQYARRDEPARGHGGRTL